MQITVKVDAELVRKGLQDLKAEAPKVGRSQFRFAAERVVRRMQAYPPERVGQTYERTGNFFSHWVIEQVEQGYQISNDVEHKGHRYGVYVVGDAYGTNQAWMHDGRWEKFRDAVDAEMEKLPDDVLEVVRMVARREGFDVR